MGLKLLLGGNWRNIFPARDYQLELFVRFRSSVWWWKEECTRSEQF